MASFSGEGFRDNVDFTVFRNRYYAGTESVQSEVINAAVSGVSFPAEAESIHGRLCRITDPHSYLKKEAFSSMKGRTEKVVMCCRCRKGQFGIYDCRERPVGGRLLLAFLAGFISGVSVVIYALSYISVP
ncbi:TPA: hypothetical protein IBK98_004777 [Escherichia coli]|nr:hypothetical protein [Escherichia coli]HAM3731007.1 hypothetical protein [Escherichia coli]HAM4871508.1 hypothetical protein [Escherichia coli]